MDHIITSQDLLIEILSDTSYKTLAENLLLPLPYLLLASCYGTVRIIFTT